MKAFFARLLKLAIMIGSLWTCSELAESQLGVAGNYATLLASILSLGVVFKWARQDLQDDIDLECGLIVKEVNRAE